MKITIVWPIGHQEDPIVYQSLMRVEYCDHVPRIGEGIEVLNGWGTKKIEDVTWFHDMSGVEVRLTRSVLCESDYVSACEGFGLSSNDRRSEFPKKLEMEP